MINTFALELASEEYTSFSIKVTQTVTGYIWQCIIPGTEIVAGIFRYPVLLFATFISITWNILWYIDNLWVLSLPSSIHQINKY